MLCLPELARARLAEFVERCCADQRFQFLACRRDAAEEISQRLERPAFTRFKYRVSRARGESLHSRYWHADEIAVRHEGWSGFVHRWCDKFQTKPMTFENI